MALTEPHFSSSFENRCPWLVLVSVSAKKKRVPFVTHAFGDPCALRFQTEVKG